MRKERFVYRGLAMLLCLATIVGLVPAGIIGSVTQANAVTAEPVVQNTVSNELISNGGFDGDAMEWSMSSGAQGKIEHVDGMVKFTAAVETGDDGAELKRTNTELYQILSADTGVSIKPYEAYELKVKYKWISGDSKPYIGVWFYENNTANSSFRGYSYTYPTDQSGEWVELTVDVMVPADANIAKVEIGTNTSTTVSFMVDDVSLVKTNTYVYYDSFDTYNDGVAAAGPAGWLDNDVEDGGLVTCLTGSNAFSGAALHFQNYDSLWAESPRFEVKAGYDYTVEFKAKKSLNNGQFTGYAELVFLNANGEQVGSVDRYTGKTYGEWTKEGFIALAPEGAVEAYMVFACRTRLGAYGVDDLRVSESAAPSDRDPSQEAPEIAPVYVPKLTNPGFEEELKGWKGYVSSGASVTVVTDDVNSGEKALLITAVPSETDKAVHYQAQSLDVEGIEALELSVMAKRISGEGKAYIMLAFYDKNNNLVPTGTAFMGAIAEGPEWSKSTMIQAVPKDAATVTVEFGNSSKQLITYMVDDISLDVYTGPADKINPALPSAPSGGSSGGSANTQIYEPGKMNNSFEELDEYGNPTVWRAVGNANFALVEAADAPNGKYVYQMEKISGGPSIYSGRIAVEPGKTYDLKLMMKDMEVGKRALLNFNFYDADGKNIYAKLLSTDGSGKWKMYVHSVIAPEGAVSACAEVWYAVSGAGTVQVDAMILQESDTPAEEPFAPSPYTAPTVDEILGNMTAEHPRIMFSAEEAKQIKLRRFNTLKTKYGFTWYSRYDELVKLADAYLEMKQVKVSMNTGKHVMMDIYPVLRDPNDPYYDPIYIEASLDENGELFDKTVWTGFGSLVTDDLRDMLQVWCLAYVMTGKDKYAERAISFAMQIADWEWWGDYDWMVLSKVKTDASMGWMATGMAIVYDVLYDELTPEQRSKIERAMIDKALAPLAADAKPMDTQNVNMMKIGGLLTGCAAIVSEDNIEEIKPYIDAALLCAHNALDTYAYSGNTEGHYYTNFGLETFIVGLGHMYRATHAPGMVDHPFLTDILPYWTVMWGAPGNGTHPNYSDAGIGAYMKLPMAVISSLTDNPVIDGFLINAKGTGDAYYDFIYLDPEPKPEYLSDYAGVVEEFGYGALRTGFAKEDMLLVLKANDSNMGHNHMDQNSIQLNLGGSWLIQDPGVGSYYYTDRRFWTTNGHSTILVDGSAQMTMGTGSTELVFNNDLYSYIIGSAPGAYGADYDGQVLQKFDRHAIQINHADKDYYLIIDDLLSTKNRTYGWQMYNGNRQMFSVDGVTVEQRQSAMGNLVSMPIGKDMLNLNFIGNDQLLVADQEYTNADATATFGFTLTATTTAATKAHQFMTTISFAENRNKNYYSFLTALDNRRFTLPEKLDDPTDITWDSSMPMGQEIIKENQIDSFMCLFFRGNKAGDWLNIPFEIAEDGKYELTLELGASTGCCRIKAIIDGKYESDVVDCSGWPEYLVKVPFGELELEAGQHDVRMEIVGPGYNEGYEPGWYLINAAGLDIARVGVEVAESEDIEIAEVYDTAEALGGLINYIDNKYDMLMWNRTTGAATAGLLNTDGQQASVLGIVDGAITEGFAATNATTMTYDGKVLFLAEKKVNIVASSTGWQVISDEAQNIQLPAIAPELDYVITVNGAAVDTKIENGLITLAVEAGETKIALDVREPEATDPTDPAETDPTDPAQTDPTVAPTDPAPVEDGNDATLWIIIGVIVVLLTAAAVGVVLFLKKRKNI